MQHTLSELFLIHDWILNSSTCLWLVLPMSLLLSQRKWFLNEFFCPIICPWLVFKLIHLCFLDNDRSLHGFYCIIVLKQSLKWFICVTISLWIVPVISVFYLVHSYPFYPLLSLILSVTWSKPVQARDSLTF